MDIITVRQWLRVSMPGTVGTRWTVSHRKWIRVRSSWYG